MAKARKRKTDNVVAMPTAEPTHVITSQSAQLPASDIARRAFEIYCERGCQPGQELEDWLRAERELQSATHYSVA